MRIPRLLGTGAPSEREGWTHVHCAQELFDGMPTKNLGKEALGDGVLPNGTRVAKGTRSSSASTHGRDMGIGETIATSSGRSGGSPEAAGSGTSPATSSLCSNCGPRSCLGRNVGLSNLKIAAAVIIYNFRLELVDGQIVEPLNSVVLHTKNGLRNPFKSNCAAMQEPFVYATYQQNRKGNNCCCCKDDCLYTQNQRNYVQGSRNWKTNQKSRSSKSRPLSRVPIVVLATIKKSCNVPNDWAQKT
ncbi:hypothetical protein EJB05_33203, partial [Eragrostis curvula]